MVVSELSERLQALTTDATNALNGTRVPAKQALAQDKSVITFPLLEELADSLLKQNSSHLKSIQPTMGVEESVYLAKLAEQAERYEGE